MFEVKNSIVQIKSLVESLINRMDHRKQGTSVRRLEIKITSFRKYKNKGKYGCNL